MRRFGLASELLFHDASIYIKDKLRCETIKITSTFVWPTFCAQLLPRNFSSVIVDIA